MYRPIVPDNLGGGKKSSNEVAGRDRHKFFRRPVVGGIKAAAAASDAGNSNPQQQGGRLYAASQRGMAIPQQTQMFVPSNPNNNNNANQQPMQRFANSAPAKRALPRTQLSPMKEGGAPLSSRRSPSNESNNNNHDPNAPREIAIQTLMRENDCQTDPFTPEVVFEAGKNPPVYALRELRLGEGLPARQSEIEMIDRIQRFREEMMMPPSRSAFVNWKD
jgi:hypothetical protein